MHLFYVASRTPGRSPDRPSELSGRITAEKYVAAVYGLFVLVFFGYVMIHAAKVCRFRGEIDSLKRHPESSAEADSVAG